MGFGFYHLLWSYGRRAFNFQTTLDNFYRKQHIDGFICREISEEEGDDTFHRFDPSSTGPNVMPWAEWNNYLKTGDRSRLEMVFPPLWLTTNGCAYIVPGRMVLIGQPVGDLAWTISPVLKESEQVLWGNGQMTWVDATFQALLSAKILLQMAASLGQEHKVPDLYQEVAMLERMPTNISGMSDFSSIAIDSLMNSPPCKTYWSLLVVTNRLYP